MTINITMPDESLTFKKRDYKQVREELKFRHSGVYFLYDANDVLLYVGKTNNFRSRLLAHFRGRDASANFYKLIDSVTVYFVSDDYQREVYETFAINTFHPAFNKSKAFFVDNSDEIYEIDEMIRDLEDELAELESDMCDDGLVDRDYEEDSQYLAGIYFHNRERMDELRTEIKALKRRKSLL